MDWRKKSIINLSDDFNSMYDSVIKSLVTYLKDNPQIHNLILGISGGIDSAVIASLARAVCNIMPTVKLGQLSS
jgi:NH3-dependent NAD+ synthetase